MQGLQEEVAGLCGYECPENGLVKGNAAVSGVSSADRLLASVLQTKRATDALSFAIEQEMKAAGADFGVSGELGVELVGLAETFTELLRVHVAPPACSIDADTLLDALERCDASFDRDVGVSCIGACELAVADPSCPAGSSLRCNDPAHGDCGDGLCRGTCTTEVADAACAGDCLGTCVGMCDQLDAQGRCAGPCAGSCDGECRRPSFEASVCDGRCDGACVRDESQGCERGLLAECVTPITGTAAACAGRCRGESVIEGALAECELSAKLDAISRLACQHAGARIDAIGKAGPEDAATQARVLRALQNLEGRLPQLLLLSEKGERLYSVSQDLRDRVTDETIARSFEMQNEGDIEPRLAVGLECASDQLADLPTLLDQSEIRLDAALRQIDELMRALGGES